MGFFRQGHWSGLPLPSPRKLPGPGIKPRSPELQADSLPTELPGKPQQNIVSLFHFMTSKSSSLGNTLLMCEVLIHPCSLPSSLQSLPRVYINVHDYYFLDQISRILNSRFSIYFNFFLSLFSHSL